MNHTAFDSTVRELDRRRSDGIEVRLLWNSLTNSVSVSVHDARCAASFQFDVAPARALDAFHHPFVYAGNDHDPRATRHDDLPGGRPRGRTNDDQS